MKQILIFIQLILTFNVFAQITNPTLNYVHNPHLITINPSWTGTPIDKNDRFVNHEYPFEAKFSDVLKWQFGPRLQKLEKKNDKFRLNASTDTSFIESTNDCIVWLGHSSFFIRLNGISILIDPVFYKVPFVKRYADHAFGPDIFIKLDYLLISHDHQDHCQKKSIKKIVSLNPHIKILTGLNMEGLLQSWVKNVLIETAGWYQQYNTVPGLQIAFLPSRHWAKRSLNDTNKRLWGGFVIHTSEKVIYFSGDTGYGNHFKEAKALFPSIDVAIIGVGAYKPEWFMSPNHISPPDAVKAFGELGAKVFIPMHYGTFDLSDEPVGEPLRMLQKLDKDGAIKGQFKALDVGENYSF